MKKTNFWCKMFNICCVNAQSQSFFWHLSGFRFDTKAALTHFREARVCLSNLQISVKVTDSASLSQWTFFWSKMWQQEGSERLILITQALISSFDDVWNTDMLFFSPYCSVSDTPKCLLLLNSLAFQQFIAQTNAFYNFLLFLGNDQLKMQLEFPVKNWRQICKFPHTALGSNIIRFELGSPVVKHLPISQKANPHLAEGGALKLKATYLCTVGPLS